MGGGNINSPATLNPYLCMKKDYIFLSISIDITLMPIYDGRPEVQITSSTLSTNVNTKRIGLVGGCWGLSLPETVGNPVSMYHLPILLIKLRRNINNPLLNHRKITSINSILNKFEKLAPGGFILSTLNKQKLQDALIQKLASTYGDKILRINKL